MTSGQTSRVGGSAAARISTRTTNVSEQSWSEQLSGAVTSTRDLLDRLALCPSEIDADLDPEFPVRVPLAYLAKMKPGDPRDPLLLQVLPRLQERQSRPGYSADALDERAATLAPGLIQKYHGRALLIAAPVCAVNCRYCFRRSFPYGEHRLGPDAAALEALANDTSIREVILSGGDPLVLKDAQLDKLIGRLEAMPQLVRLRIHTRVPVVIPDRVTAALVARLQRSRLQASVVLHVNHANEIDQALEEASARLANAGIQLLNQSVLLAGINDSASSLIELSERLFAARVLPYYLHLLDRVTGTHHFSVSEERAVQLYETLRKTLPGYLVPRLAKEIPGDAAKRWLMA